MSVNINNKIVSAMLQGIKNRMYIEVSDRMVLNAIHFNISCLLGMKRNDGRGVLKDENGMSIINYYGITFGESGRGKDKTNDLAREYFSNEFDKFTGIISSEVTANQGVVPTGDMPEQTQYMLPNDIVLPIDGTREAFYLTRQAFDIANGGSLNIIESEIGDKILRADDMLMVLKETWTDGNSNAKRTVSGSYRPVKNVPTNALMFGSPHTIKKTEKKQEQYNDFMISGLGRRSFVYFSDTDDIIHKELGDESVFYNVKTYCETTLTKFKDEIGPNNFFSLSSEARKMIVEYNKEIIDKANSSLSPLNRALIDINKTKRLAALYAFVDCRLLISCDDMNDAINFDRMSNENIIESARGFTEFELIYKILNNNNNVPMTDSSIILEAKNHGLKITQKSFRESIETVRSYAHNIGSVFKEKIESEIIFYNVKPLKMTANKDIKVGYSMNQYSNFNTQSGVFTHDMIGWMNGKSITPWIFNEEPLNNGYSTNRSKENAIEAYMVVFDFERQINSDTGEVFEMSVAEAEEIFEEYEYIIRTSKSHNINDKGERFHIYILLEFVMTMQSDEFKQTYLNIAKRFGIFKYIDRSTSVRASLFNEAEKPIYTNFNEGIALDYRCCLPETREADIVEHNYSEIENVEFTNIRLKRYLNKVIATIGKGNRDNSINTFVYKAINDIKAEPADISVALDVLKATVNFDSSFKESDFNKFYKRL